VLFSPRDLRNCLLAATGSSPHTSHIHRTLLVSSPPPFLHTHHTYIARFSSPLLLPFSTPPPSPLPSLSAQGAFSSRRRRLLHSVVHSFFFSPSFSLLLFLSFFFSPSDTITLSRRYFSLFSCNKTKSACSWRKLEEVLIVVVTSITSTHPVSTMLARTSQHASRTKPRE
jgi:hypothetical protein